MIQSWLITHAPAPSMIWHIRSAGGIQALAEQLRQEAARERDRAIQRTRMGIAPFRKPKRGEVGYWWRRKWLREI